MIDNHRIKNSSPVVLLFTFFILYVIMAESDKFKLLIFINKENIIMNYKKKKL